MNHEFTTIERYITEAVRKKRIAAKISPNKLSLEIGLSRGFISRVENPKIREKYNFNHLNEISKVLKCSIADFFPEPNVKEDCIEEYQKIHPRPERD